MEANNASQFGDVADSWVPLSPHHASVDKEVERVKLVLNGCGDYPHKQKIQRRPAVQGDGVDIDKLT